MPQRSYAGNAYDLAFIEPPFIINYSKSLIFTQKDIMSITSQEELFGIEQVSNAVATTLKQMREQATVMTGTIPTASKRTQ